MAGSVEQINTSLPPAPQPLTVQSVVLKLLRFVPWWTYALVAAYLYVRYSESGKKVQDKARRYVRSPSLRREVEKRGMMSSIERGESDGDHR